MTDKTNDQRPDPRPRKLNQLWQSYLWWNEMMEMRKRHTLRISSAERGKSNMDAQFERDMMDGMSLDDWVEDTRKMMVAFGQTAGPIWDWLTSIKGLGAGGLAAQLLAHIDYPAPYEVDGVPSHPEHCATISKLWRYAGWAVIDGKIDRCKKGEKSPYNRRLKSVCWQIVDQFIKQQTPYYVDVYYAEKERQRRLYPEPIKENGKWKFNDGHLHNRAIRYTAKRFLSHLWVKWREFEGLPVSKPWIATQPGHSHIQPPPE